MGTYESGNTDDNLGTAPGNGALRDSAHTMTQQSLAPASEKQPVKWLYIQFQVLKENAKATDLLKPEPIAPKLGTWTPWKCRPDEAHDFVVALALNQFLRSSGYLKKPALASYAPIIIQASYYDDATPLYPNGNPRRCNSIVYTINPESQGK